MAGVDHMEAARLRGEARRLLGPRPDLAADAARTLLRSTPQDPELRLLLGSALRRTGEVAETRAVLERLAAEQPGAWGVQFELGASLACAGEAESAIGRLEKAVRLNGRSMLARHALADQAGDPDGSGAPWAEPSLRDAVRSIFTGHRAEGEKRLAEGWGLQSADVMVANLVGAVGLAIGQAEAVVLLLEPYLARFPAFDALHARHALALLQAHEPQRAEAAASHLLARRPHALAPAAVWAAALTRLGEYEAAAELYADLAGRFPTQPGLWLSLGHALKALGRQAEALEAYRRVLALRPTSGEAYWSIANLKVARFTPIECDAMQVLAARADLPDADRIPLLFALGKALEDLGQDEAAFGCYREGNRLKRASAPYDAARHSDFVERSRASLTAAFFAEREEVGDPSAAPIFIVGLPRSGSTLVEQVLASHSQVEGLSELPDLLVLAERAARAVGSLEDYPASLTRSPKAAFAELGRAYLDRVQVYRKTNRPFFVDKFPGNVLHVGLIHLALPNARIIDVRRDPMATCFSGFKQLYAEGQNYSYDLEDLGRYYVDYLRLMQGFDEAAPGRVHRLVYEDLVTDPEAETRRLLAYCGLDFEAACLKFHENPRAVGTASAAQVRRPISREGLDHWRRFEAWLGPLKTSLGEQAAQ